MRYLYLHTSEKMIGGAYLFSLVLFCFLHRYLEMGGLSNIHKRYSDFSGAPANLSAMQHINNFTLLLLDHFDDIFVR